MSMKKARQCLLGTSLRAYEEVNVSQWWPFVKWTDLSSEQLCCWWWYGEEYYSHSRVVRKFHYVVCSIRIFLFGCNQATSLILIASYVEITLWFARAKSARKWKLASNKKVYQFLDWWMNRSSDDQVHCHCKGATKSWSQICFRCLTFKCSKNCNLQVQSTMCSACHFLTLKAAKLNHSRYSLLIYDVIFH